MSNTKNLASLAAVLDDGTSGQVLQSTGSGGVQFADSSGSGVTVHTNQAAMLTDAASASEGTLHYETDNNKLYVKQTSGFYLLASITNVAPTIDSFSENTGGAGANNLTSGGTFTLTSGSNTVVTINATEPDLETISYSATVTSGTATNVFSSPSFPVTNQSSNAFTLTPVTSGSGGTVTIRFDASDGTNVANVTHSFSIAFTIADSHYTSLLAATDAASGDNNDITDSSSNNYTITVTGDAHAGTFSPYRHGGYSTYFDGSGDYVRISSIADLSSGSWTIEGWYYFEADPNSSNTAFWALNTASVNGYAWMFTSGTTLYVQQRGTGTYSSSGTYDFDVNKWYHIATVWDNSAGTLRVYVNGTQVIASTTNPIQNAGNGFTLGADGYGSNLITGFVSDFRIVTSAVYTSAFTPPTERLTAITNTELLTCHLPYISDGSSNDYTITVNGSVSTKPFGPYDYAEYSASDNGGSLYFDGTGDYVRISSIADLSSGSWTIEGWYYFEADPNSSATCFWALNTSSVNGYAFLLTRGNNPTIFSIQQRGTGTYTSEATYDFDVNRWYHIATVWDNSAGTLKIYVNGKEEVSGTANPIQNSGNGLTLGADGYGSSLITGFVSDFRIKQTAEYTAEFTPPTAPLSSSSTVLHIKGTDAHVIDKSQSANLKLVGTAAAVTDAPNNSTISSTNAVSFDGDSDYITVPNSSINDLGTGDFTIECWFKSSDGTLNTHACLVASYASTVAGSWSLKASSSNTGYVQWAYYTTTYNDEVSTTNIASDQNWHHVAVTRSNGSMNLWVDGSSVKSWTSSYDFSGGGHPLTIGFQAQDTTSYIDGYMQDVRITKGLARYTSSFTVPSSPLKG